jgi:membrane peptidoglycan carboxypeptidase
MIGDYLEDHGLPLAQLKQRRDLIVALMVRTGRITKQQIAEIAAIQSSRPLPLSKLSLSISIPKSSRRC